MITDVPGIRVGHATDEENHTGCTVILCPPDTVGGVDVRGLSPGSRETALLAPDKKMMEVHAVLLTGGSAFGLAAADGVMRYLEEREIGYWTPLARVPIVPAAVVFDLFLGGGVQRPDREMGYTACQNATAGPVAQGNVGAGAGVTVGKWSGFDGPMKGGFGTASAAIDNGKGDRLVVGVAVVTNCTGDVLDHDGRVIAGARAPDGGWAVEGNPMRWVPKDAFTLPGTNTTLAVAATNARMTKAEANRLAQRVHDGMAIAIRPVHTFHDGDTAFGLATGQVDAAYDLVANAVVETTAEAIRNAVREASSVGRIPGLSN